MTKTIMILAIVAAFVAGTLVTNAPQIAQADETEELIATLLGLIIDIETQVIALELAEGHTQKLVVTERLGSEVTVVNLGSNSGESECLAGEQVVGGGFVTTSGTNELLAKVVEDRGSQADGKWFVTIEHDKPSDGAEYKFKVQAMCAKLT